MRKLFFTPFALVAFLSRAQLFESQMTYFNAAYTGMQDERFADLNLFGFRFWSSVNFLSSGAAYQQNLEKINSGFGAVLGHNHLSSESDNLNAYNASLSYRYALSFENGLRLSAGTRLGFSHIRVSNDDDFGQFNGMILGLGAMGSYRNFTFGLSMPGLHNGFALSGSYRGNINERIELTIMTASFVSRFMFQQTVTAKAEFNQKFWFATRFMFDRHPYIYNAKFSTGLHFGHRIKDRFHIFGGTDFGFTSNSFSIYNPALGFIYQFQGQL